MSSVQPLLSSSRQSPSGLGTVFQAIALTKIYRMGEVDVPALRGVDLTLHEGEFMVLLGVSGSGKSTLLNIMGGLDVPTNGRVYYRDEELTIVSEAQLTRYRRYHVGFVFQFYNLIPSLPLAAARPPALRHGASKHLHYANAGAYSILSSAYRRASCPLRR